MNYKIGLKTRVKILNSLVRSRLTYSCQCWTLIEKQKQKLTSTYNGFLRRMVKGGLSKEGKFVEPHPNQQRNTEDVQY